MGIRVPKIVLQAKHTIIHRRSNENPSIKYVRLISVTPRPHDHDRRRGGVPKGHFAVYVGNQGEEKGKRFVVPISYLNHPSFQDLLVKAAEEFGFDHPMGVISIPCTEEHFENLTSLF